MYTGFISAKKTSFQQCFVVYQRKCTRTGASSFEKYFAPVRESMHVYVDIGRTLLKAEKVVCFRSYSVVYLEYKF